jgi:hypothetical protein
MAMTSAQREGWIPAQQHPDHEGEEYRVRAFRPVLGIPEEVETTAMWTDEGWEFTDGLMQPEKYRVTAWKPKGE